MRLMSFYILTFSSLLFNAPLEEEFLNAAADGNVPRVKELIKNYHIPVNTKVAYSWMQPIPQKGPTHYQRSDVTALVRAVESNQLAVIQYLLDNGADINAPLKQSSRVDMSAGLRHAFSPWHDEFIYPLSISLANNNVALSEYLIRRGAQVQPQDLRRYRALFHR